MPVIKVPIPNSDYTVSRNAIMSVIEDLKRYTYMGDDVNIMFPNDSDLVPTKGSAIGDTDRKVTYLTQKTLRVEVEEDTDPEFMLNVHVNSRNNIPIFGDSDIDFVMTPVNFRHNVTLSIKFRSDSRSEVINWRNGIKVRLAEYAQFGLLHTLKFYYHIPNENYEIMKIVHDLKERNYPTNEEFVNYFKRCSSERITSIHDAHGKFQSLVVQMSQSGVLGTYELTEVPEKPEKDEATSTYSATLVYKFHYMKPEYMFMRYPISVYNELMPEVLVADNGIENSPSTRAQVADYNVGVAKYFQMQEQIKRNDDVIGFARYPYYDDVNLLETFQGYKTYASFLVSLDSGRKDLLNLGELGDFKLNDAVLKFIREVEWKYINKPHMSVLSVYLQSNNKHIAYDNIKVTPNLDVSSVRELDIRHQHRVIFDVIYDWKSLPREAIDRLLEYPDAFAWILDAINRAILTVVNILRPGARRPNTDNSAHGSNQSGSGRAYEAGDFDIAIAILEGKAPNDEFIGNRIYGNVPDIITREYINELIRTARRLKTVFATSIIARPVQGNKLL